ncbi:MAG: hypothetical protein KME30_32035 [Iphinoe sp. HA4291-MV1]|jgi:hypothetical protein|nr:hypothetical protein [Iphinoe sp. HA4291-MV1]
MTTTVIGISITESALASPTTITAGIQITYMVGIATATVATNQNIPVAIKDAADFATKYTGAAEIVTQSVKLFFNNYPEGKLLFVAANDPAISANPTDKGHILHVLTLLTNQRELDLGILIIPEISSYTTQADRTAIYSGAESLAQKTGWLHFTNTATATDTKAEALAERELYASQLGHSALYYGMGIDADDKQVPINVAAAAIALRRFKEDSAYSPPGGAQYPIKGIKLVSGYVTSETDFTELRDKGINVIQKIPKVGLCFWGARTLATDTKFSQINSRVAISLLNRQLQESLTPLLFESSDPQGYTRREVIRIAVSLLQQAYVNGGLSGTTPEEAYRVVELDVPSDSSIPNLRRVQIKIYARFVDTLEQIEIQLINVDIIPSVQAA